MLFFLLLRFFFSTKDESSQSFSFLSNKYAKPLFEWFGWETTTTTQPEVKDPSESNRRKKYN